MEPESTSPAEGRPLPEWATQLTQSALLGWMVVVRLTLAGFVLLATADAPVWVSWTFAALGIAGVAAYGILVYPFCSRLERRLPVAEEHWQRLESHLVTVFDEIGAG